MEFIKITEQPSLYDDLDKKSVKEILEDSGMGELVTEATE